MVPLITTTTADSYYLKGESTTYPTALLDFDGNERASIHLRDSDLNLLHILCSNCSARNCRKSRLAATDEFFTALMERRRLTWQEESQRTES